MRFVKIKKRKAENIMTSQNTNNIVTVASSAGIFNALVATVKAADLVETLQVPGPFTVVAPNVEAFEKLPK